MELLILGLAFIILGSPWILTLLNIINLFKKYQIKKFFLLKSLKLYFYLIFLILNI